MGRAPTILLLAALLAGLAAGCNDAGDVFDRSVPPDFRVSAASLDGSGKSRAVFAPGELVTLRLTVVNATDAYQTLTFASSQKYDFVVEDAAGTEIWRWSFPLVFTPAADRMDFRPRQSVVFEEVWGQVANDGSAVPTGDYGFKAVLTAETPGPMSTSGPLAIR